MKIKNLVLSSTAALALFALSTTVANADTVTVKAGDTVSEIAEAHNTTVSAIEKANKLANVNLIFVGDKLEVNGTSTTTATSAAPQSAAASQATSTASASVTSASSAAPKSVASQASSSVASQASSSVASSASTSQATSSASHSTSAASTATSTSSAASSSASSASSSASTSSTSSYTGSNLRSYVLSQMQSRTGVSASTWNTIITRESGWNTTVKNSTSGAYGLFQNMHISSGSVEAQVDAAVALYNAQGMQAWAL
ncbi:LysM peptidoglycan-binding domain-containing protein [Lactiplantibacillus plajomi]|uniref:LysM peptidoglycan-binding domain-containing protein n=1 Tax=Lactiplantibacillus plajomi TaxID=1457217 RepID=A0ABV6K281_9LACO|nr:LysM peptidoglycan-binding domain-containing protein [Lactiplantibacillus plajomi]